MGHAAGWPKALYFLSLSFSSSLFLSISFLKILFPLLSLPYHSLIVSLSLSSPPPFSPYHSVSLRPPMPLRELHAFSRNWSPHLFSFRNILFNWFSTTLYNSRDPYHRRCSSSIRDTGGLDGATLLLWSMNSPKNYFSLIFNANSTSIRFPCNVNIFFNKENFINKFMYTHNFITGITNWKLI